MKTDTMRGKVLALIVCGVSCYGAAAVGGLFTARAVADWYPTLAKPSWTPPSWVFGPVWTVLYGMMALAAWLVWLRRGRRPWGAAVVVFVVQLVLNAAWSPLFFGLHRPGIAFVDIAALWAALAVTVWLFFRVRWAAGVLLAPYLLWVSFAGALNFAIWRLNA